ncbi:MAG: S8 family serine peptidase [Acidobacteria bacterium]|nr:S8 family serine peptidase [Acidobacteriota bacterium]
MKAINLAGVTTHIKADRSWLISQGKGVHIAIVDTGISDMLEFPIWKRSKYSWPSYSSAWNDKVGHGSMVGSIAAATTEHGGRYNGVAPGAKLISCQTNFEEQQLCLIYEYLINLVESKKIDRLVINNSYGVSKEQAINQDFNAPFLKMIRYAVSRGIVVVFPAGNNHVLRCGNKTSDHKNSIWGANSLDEVICVGTVDENNCLDKFPKKGYGFGHRDSSRGPGQFAKNTIKPDCVAPTYGEVLWGQHYEVKEWWGTSGAAAQVAGLAALLIAKYPTLTPQQVQKIIRKSCTPLPYNAVCVGSGLIDCLKAIKLTNEITLD